jgi:hypothetical protein
MSLISMIAVCLECIIGCKWFSSRKRLGQLAVYWRQDETMPTVPVPVSPLLTAIKIRHAPVVIGAYGRHFNERE